MLLFKGNVNIEAKLGIFKNIHGIGLEFISNQNFNANQNQKVELTLRHGF